MTALRVSESELRALLVTELEAVEAAEFDKALLMSHRLKIPLERTAPRRCKSTGLARYPTVPGPTDAPTRPTGTPR